MIVLKEVGKNYINAYPDINAAINNIIKKLERYNNDTHKIRCIFYIALLNNRINCKINGKEKLLKDLEFNQCAIAVIN